MDGITLGAAALGLVSGFSGWVATEFFAKPFRRGMDLVADARTRAVIFGNVLARARASDPDEAFFVPLTLSPSEEQRLLEAEKSYREIGAIMLSFASTERAASAILKRAGFDLEDAGRAFIGLSNSVGRYGKMRHAASQHVEKAIRLRV